MSEGVTTPLQCGAVCCSVLQDVAVCCSVLQCVTGVGVSEGVTTLTWGHGRCVLQCIAVCCSMLLQFVAVCCSMLQYVAVSSLP